MTTIHPDGGFLLLIFQKGTNYEKDSSRSCTGSIHPAVRLFGSRQANANISKQADYFESERKITVYNARTDKVILEAEGYMSISNNDNNELVCTVKVGPDTYRKNYIYLNDYTMYVVEDITGTHTDPYHYKLYFHTDILPSVEVKAVKVIHQKSPILTTMCPEKGFIVVFSCRFSSCWQSTGLLIRGRRVQLPQAAPCGGRRVPRHNRTRTENRVTKPRFSPQKGAFPP